MAPLKKGNGPVSVSLWAVSVRLTISLVSKESGLPTASF
jgi:hypothetical protein